MHVKYLHYLLFIILIGCLQSCVPHYYTPGTHNVPMIDDKGDGTASFTTDLAQYELQAAYAPADNLAFQVNAGFNFPRIASSGLGGRSSYAELGLGYFNKVEENLSFETYALFKFGTLYYNRSEDSNIARNTYGNISSRFFTYGLQPSLSFKRKNFAFGFSMKILMLEYSKIQGNMIYSGEDQVAYLLNNRKHVLLEPAVTFRWGNEKVLYGQAQVGYSANFSHPGFRQYHTFITLGVVKPFSLK